MRQTILAALLGLGLLGGTATATPGQAADPGFAAARGMEAIVPVQYRPDYHRPHYVPPPRRHYVPRRPPYHVRHAPPPRPYAPPPRPYHRHY